LISEDAQEPYGYTLGDNFFDAIAAYGSLEGIITTQVSTSSDGRVYTTVNSLQFVLTSCADGYTECENGGTCAHALAPLCSPLCSSPPRR
jgi:hypothetical protein